MATTSSIRAWPQPAAGAPPGLGRGLVLLLGAAAVVVTAAGIRLGAEIVAPVMLGLVLTIAVLPLTRWANRHGWPGWAGTLLALVAACLIVLVLLLGTVLAIVKLVDLLPQYADDARSLRADGTDFLTATESALDQPPRRSTSSIPPS